MKLHFRDLVLLKHKDSGAEVLLKKVQNYKNGVKDNDLYYEDTVPGLGLYYYESFGNILITNE